MFKLFLISTFVLAASAAVIVYQCPPEGQHFFRYPYDCSQFVECNEGKAVLNNCIAGLIFNEELGFCDFPENVECVEEEGGPEGQCPEENGEWAVLLPHTTDCTKFFECDWGVLYLMECPEDLYFNAELNVCDNKEDSGCVPK